MAAGAETRGAESPLGSAASSESEEDRGPRSLSKPTRSISESTCCSRSGRSSSKSSTLSSQLQRSVSKASSGLGRRQGSRQGSLELMPAPLLHRSCSQPVSTWFGAGEPLPSCPSRPCWRKLGDAWRQWEEPGVDGQHVRCPGDSRDFAQACIPKWSKGAKIRTRGLLEHELTWAYYRMRRHEAHPQRQAVGEFLDKEKLPEKMRFGRHAIFQFWRDLRPPFSVLDFRRVDAGEDVPTTTANGNIEEAEPEIATTAMEDSGPHPDGELYSVTYECPIEYVAERLMDDKKDASTFDNKIKGVAMVRIPNSFPQMRRCLHIKSWGQPTLNPPEDWDLASSKTKSVRPDKVSPVIPVLPPAERSLSMSVWEAKEIQKWGTTRTDMKKKLVKVPPLEQLKLGKHVSLPRLERQQSLGSTTSEAFDVTGLSEGHDAAEKAIDEEPRRVRRHRIFTAAVGFVSYAG